jgi:hypothetical protein
MATFIKAGFWEQLCKPCRGYKGWLNLDQLITSLLPAPAYRVYTALLTQSGTNDPVPTVVDNTLGGVPVWTRAGTAGAYDITLNGAFPVNKTLIFLTLYGTDADGRYVSQVNYAGSANNNERRIVIKNATTNAFADGIGALSTIEIRVYN